MTGYGLPTTNPNHTTGNGLPTTKRGYASRTKRQGGGAKALPYLIPSPVDNLIPNFVPSLWITWAKLWITRGSQTDLSTPVENSVENLARSPDSKSRLYISERGWPLLWSVKNIVPK